MKKKKDKIIFRSKYKDNVYYNKLLQIELNSICNNLYVYFNKYINKMILN